MSSQLAERPVEPLRGVQEPRILAAPPSFDCGASGDEVCDFVARYGLVLDPWQRTAMRVAMGESVDRKWSAFEVAVIVARQNGKGSLLEAREMAGLFLLGEELMVHTAHLFKTSHEAFLRVARLVRDSPDLMKRVHRIYSSPSNEGIELKNGHRLLFLARSGGSGRGFSGDWVCLDEAYDLPEDVMDALVPTMSARPNAQMWYMSSAGKESSKVLQGVRARALAGETDSLAYLEWSAPDGVRSDDRQAWAQANPALGIRITEQAIIRERAALSEAGFLRERLTLWPEMGHGPLSAAWLSLTDVTSSLAGAVTYGLGVAADRSWACVGAAGANPGGLTHVEYGIYQRQTGWVVDWLAELASRKRIRVAVRPQSEAGSLIPALEARRIEVVPISQTEYAQACGDFDDSVMARRDVRHLGQPALDLAVAAAVKRTSSDGSMWDQRRSDTDISPLEAVTLAAHAHRNKPVRSGRFLAL